MKINFLLPPYKGESFYSFICRHRKLTGSNYLHISKTFFNGYSHPVNQRLPFDLDKFTKRIEHISVLTTDEIILNHSLYPLYSSFMSSERSQNLYSFMRSNRGSTNHFVKIDADLSEFRYCRHCAEEEYSKSGESFWHTDHSIPFMQACTKHNCQLSVWKVPSEIYNVRHYYECDFKKLRNESSGSFEISNVVLNSAERLVAIQNKLVDVDLNKFFDVARQKDFFQIRKNTYSLNQSLLSKYITFLDDNGADFANAIRSRPVVVNALFSRRMHPFNPHNFSYLTEFLESIYRGVIKFSRLGNKVF